MSTTQSAVARLEAGVGNAAIRTVSRPADVPGCVLELEPKDESGDPPSPLS